MVTRATALTALVPLLVVAACANPATDKPQAVVDEPAQDTQPAGQGRRFVVAEGSTLGFVGSKVTGSEEGEFRAFSGEIDVVNGDPERSTVNVTIDATSLWTPKERLTGHLKSSDFFDVATHPSATFSSTAIARDGDHYAVTGNLTLHGVTKSITFPATIEVTDSAVHAQAEFAIKRFDFGIAFKGAADDLIRDDVLVRFDLHATPAPESPA